MDIAWAPLIASFLGGVFISLAFTALTAVLYFALTVNFGLVLFLAGFLVFCIAFTLLFINS